MQTLKSFYRLARPFWFARSQWREWLMLATVLGFTVAIIRISVLIADWDKKFYDALAAFNGQAMPALIAEYLGYMAMMVCCIVCGDWLQKKLMFRWRSHLTAQFEQRWLAEGSHYRLQLNREPDNPDQRIAEDIYLLADKSISLFRNFFNNVLKFSAFVGVLWELSGVQQFTLFGQQFTVHGYLVWVALGYSALATVAAHLVGRKLKHLNIERQHREADYRATLLRVRDHAEQIAFYRGENAESRRLRTRFSRISDNWRRLISREFKQETFWAVYVRISIFIPIVATLPMYLAHTLTFGDMMQTRTSFARVQDSFGWFTDVYRRLMEWAATVERLSGFQAALDETLNETERTKQPAPEETAFSDSLKEPEARQKQPAPADNLIRAEGISVATAQGRILLQNLDFQAQGSEWLLFDGRSGIGKSTLMRVFAGLWPYYQGRYILNARRSLFLPQRPYLPYASLRESLCYPHPPQADDAQLAAVLKQVGLPLPAGGLDGKCEWASLLSGGEQQRLSIARALLARPDVLFLDEATNQMDDETAAALMSLLRRELPDTLCIAVSHQVAVKALFARRLTLDEAVPQED